MILNIAYSSDNNYCRLLATSMVSLFESNKDVDHINVFCLLYRADENNKNELLRIGEKYNRKISIIETQNICEEFRFWEKGEDGRYIRLLLPLLISVDTILYLDCDIMVRRNLTDLFGTNLTAVYHAAVLDTVRQNARKESHIRDLDVYFNSGVMLVNLAKWRKDKIIEKFKSFKLCYSDKGIYRDQRVLNGVTSEQYKTLSPSYNLTPELLQFSCSQIKEISGVNKFYSQSVVDGVKHNPHIVHFSGRSIDRPWYANCKHPFCKEYRDIMAKDRYTNVSLKKDSCKNVILWRLKRVLPFFLLKIIILRKNK